MKTKHILLLLLTLAQPTLHAQELTLEQARTLAAEASAHANQVMADANQQSQNIVAEATQKAHEMIAGFL